ncbi:unnamed protein product [Closterium sp. NIES-65]|nr:unnamed protein product [Closterium sp. NIES-65]
MPRSLSELLPSLVAVHCSSPLSLPSPPPSDRMPAILPSQHHVTAWLQGKLSGPDTMPSAAFPLSSALPDSPFTPHQTACRPSCHHSTTSLHGCTASSQGRTPSPTSARPTTTPTWSVWHAVTPEVGKPAFNGPQCVQPISLKPALSSTPITQLFARKRQKTPPTDAVGTGGVDKQEAEAGGGALEEGHRVKGEEGGSEEEKQLAGVQEAPVEAGAGADEGDGASEEQAKGGSSGNEQQEGAGEQRIFLTVRAAPTSSCFCSPCCCDRHFFQATTASEGGSSERRTDAGLAGERPAQTARGDGSARRPAAESRETGAEERSNELSDDEMAEAKEEAGLEMEEEEEDSFLAHWSWAGWVRDVVELRFLENETAVRRSMPPLPPQYPASARASARGILAGDAGYVRALGEVARWWAESWRVPLQYEYDPADVAHYFNRRPHIVLLRTLKISVLLAATWVQVARDTGAIRAREAGGVSAGDERIAAIRQHSALKLKRTLLRLGPTFIKVAQSLSARPDVVGPDTAKVLAELQDRLPAFPSEDAMAVIERELGRPAAALFPLLSPTPVAAASFGQVYKGRTRDGMRVAVKVQRPRVLFLVARDIHILRMLRFHHSFSCSFPNCMLSPVTPFGRHLAHLPGAFSLSLPLLSSSSAPPAAGSEAGGGDKHGPGSIGGRVREGAVWRAGLPPGSQQRHALRCQFCSLLLPLSSMFARLLACLLSALADEFGRGLYGELDYRHEATNATLFAVRATPLPFMLACLCACVLVCLHTCPSPTPCIHCTMLMKAHAHLPGITVPAIRSDLTSRRVLTMEWVEGERTSDLLAQAQPSPSAFNPLPPITPLPRVSLACHCCADPLQKAHAHLPGITVPAIRSDLTSRRVLTMEWVEGERTSDLLAQAQGVLGAAGGEEARQRAKQKLLRMVGVGGGLMVGERGGEWYGEWEGQWESGGGLELLVSTVGIGVESSLEQLLVGIGVESSLEQLLVTGVLHADPHPGNLLLTPQGQVACLHGAMFAQVFAWGHVLHLPLLLLASSLSSTLQLSGLWAAVSYGAAALVLQIFFHLLLPPLASSLTSTLSSYLDFGLLCRMERQHQQAMLAAVAHLVNGEWSMLAADLAAMDVLKPTTDRRALTMVRPPAQGEWSMLAAGLAAMDVLKPTTDRRALTMVGSHTPPFTLMSAALRLPMPWALEEAFGRGRQRGAASGGAPTMQFGQVTSELWRMALRFRFRLPPYYTLVLRSLASLEEQPSTSPVHMPIPAGIGVAVDPSFRVFASAYPYVVRRLLTDSSPSSRHVLRQLVQTREGKLRWERFASFAASSTQAQRYNPVPPMSLLTSPSCPPSRTHTLPVFPQRHLLIPSFLVPRFSLLPHPCSDLVASLAMPSLQSPIPGMPPMPGASPLSSSSAATAGAASPRATPSPAALVMDVLLSRHAASARRVILESDMRALAEAFVSPEAEVARDKLARVVADALCASLGVAQLPLDAITASQLSSSPTRLLAPYPPPPPACCRSGIRHEWEEREGRATAAEAVARRKRLWLLLGAAFGRMGGSVVLKVRVVLAALAVLLAALGLALKRVLLDAAMRFRRLTSHWLPSQDDPAADQPAYAT